MVIKKLFLLAALPFTLCALDKAAPSDNNLLDTHVHVDDYYKPEELEQLKTLTDRTLIKKIRARAHDRLYRARRKLERHMLHHHIDDNELFLDLENQRINIKTRNYYRPGETEQLERLTDSLEDKKIRGLISNRASQRAARRRRKIERDFLIRVAAKDKR